MTISQRFENLQAWNLEIKIITHLFITSYYFGTIVDILDSLNDGEILKFKAFKKLYLSVLLDATT